MRTHRAKNVSAAMSRLIASVCVLLWLAACGSKPKYPACDGDKDCQEGEFCVDKQCVQCKDDSNCGPGKTCKNGGCVAIPGYCTTHADCPNFQICKDNACVACEQDDDCPEGKSCVDGACLAPGECVKDQDCQQGETCRDGRCQGPLRHHGDIPECSLTPVYFSFDSTTVPRDSRNVLDANAECLGKTSRSIYIVGYTDPRGTEEYNIALSDGRARAVADYLARLGVDPARFHILPKGETEAVGTDEASWRQDRRVEMTWR